MHICILTDNYTVKPLQKEDQLSLNVGQKYCRMLQGKHSAILLTFIKLPFVIKIFVLSSLDGSTGPTALESNGPYFEIMGQ